MPDNIIDFPRTFEGPRTNDWLAGYAAGLADAGRNGHDIAELLRDSGLPIEQFAEAGADEYDLEEIKQHITRGENP